MADEQPPKGWYDDPQNPGQERYWAGDHWGEARRPKGDPPPPPHPGTRSSDDKPGRFEPSQIAVGVILVLVLVAIAIGLSGRAEQQREADRFLCEHFPLEGEECD